MLLISGVFFLITYDFSTAKKDIAVEPSTNQDTQKPLETTESRNNGGVCAADSLPTDNSKTIEKDDQDGWDLVWQDEFDHNCLDTGNWNIEDWASEKNEELQYYSPANVKVEDGLLKLISKNEIFKGRDYTSGAVQSQGKFSFLYGKVEMKAKLPSGQGIFPAFWMMPDQENTWLPEIDIMEMVGHLPNEVWMVSHWLDENGALKTDYNTFIGDDFSKDFHLFSIEWTPESISWFIDDIERHRTSKFIPKEPMYLYLNTAVGGIWPGSPDNSTIFPVNYEIDYVRVFTRHKE